LTGKSKQQETLGKEKRMKEASEVTFVVSLALGLIHHHYHHGICILSASYLRASNDGDRGSLALFSRFLGLRRLDLSTYSLACVRPLFDLRCIGPQN
jgi:hypothetical protein